MSATLPSLPYTASAALRPIARDPARGVSSLRPWSLLSARKGPPARPTPFALYAPAATLRANNHPSGGEEVADTIKFPIEASHIMMFARSIGDTNPIYHDEEYAKKT